MSRTPTSLLLLAAALLLACESQTPTPTAEIPAEAPGKPAGKLYGEPLGKGQAVALAKVVGEPDKYAGQTVIVEADVKRACSRKGCWMELASSDDPKAAGCRVTFKDYGFFVPTDSAGAHARVQGVVEVETVKKSHVDHMESEGATFAHKNPDGTAREVQLVATGVELTK